jgi:phosphocarrier protein HPr
MSSAENDTTADSMVTRDLVVTNKVGIHARPAAMFVKVASRFDAEIFLEKDGERINGKSIMGLLMLAAGPGCRLRLEVSGADAEQAAKEIEELFNKKFGED